MSVPTFNSVLRNSLWIVFVLWGGQTWAQEQVADPDFTPAVKSPAYPQGGPSVAIDAAHSNIHTAEGRFGPFADLLRSDGYSVRGSAAKFGPGTLAGTDVLVVVNPLAPGPSTSAFTETECDTVRDWVHDGGSLLLVADHAPFGNASEKLAGRFGVSMGKGYVFDNLETGGITTTLTFSLKNGLLGHHSVLNGLTPEEKITVVRTFSGQSLHVPSDAMALLSFSATAREAATTEDLNAEFAAARNSSAPERVGGHSAPVKGRAQGLAMVFGKGRVVVLGEAGFLTAQLVRFANGHEVRFGMQLPGNDNQQFALNVLHWLSGLLD